MSKRGLATVGVTLALVSGCTSMGKEAASPEDAYYDSMNVGKFAQESHETLDLVGQGLCRQLGDGAPDERVLIVLVLRESTDTDAQALQVGNAIAKRWCPQYAESFQALRPDRGWP